MRARRGGGASGRGTTFAGRRSMRIGVELLRRDGSTSPPPGVEAVDSTPGGVAASASISSSPSRDRQPLADATARSIALSATDRLWSTYARTVSAAALGSLDAGFLPPRGAGCSARSSRGSRGRARRGWGCGPWTGRPRPRGGSPGREKGAKSPTSKAPLSAVPHSFRLIFGRAIISRSALEARMLFLERARAEHSR